MANLLGKFQTREFSYWKGLTKDNHLGAIFAKAPQKASNLMVQLLAYQRGKTLDTLLNQFPTKEFETDEEYTWDVIGSTEEIFHLLRLEMKMVSCSYCVNCGNGRCRHCSFLSCIW